MKTLILTLMFLLPIFLLAQDYSGSFEFEGRTRNYEVYLPENFQPNMPLVFAMHGYTENIQFIKDYTLLHEYADTAGFVVVYPEGSYTSTGKSGWNTGLRNHPFGQQNTTSDDVGFLSTLIDTLDAHYDIDSNRVYCCGFSMGGEMTYRMAIEKGELFAIKLKNKDWDWFDENYPNPGTDFLQNDNRDGLMTEAELKTGKVLRGTILKSYNWCNDGWVSITKLSRQFKIYGTPVVRKKYTDRDDEYFYKF